MKKLLIGTGNPSKLQTYKNLLKDFGFEIVSSGELNIPEPEENEKTFEAEALKKAQYYYQQTGIPTIVDDGGFEIDALNGEPGVKSNRWIGRKMTDEEIISEVIKRMDGKTDRSAKHTVALALATPFGVFSSHGEIMGVVADKPSEKRIPKFPYRSVLYLPNYNKYWVELNEEEEEILNHRRAAIEKLHDILKELSK